MELKFYSDPSIFYKDGVLQEESEASLKKLLRDYENLCKSYSRGIRKMTKAARPHTRLEWIGGKEPQFLEDTSRNYGHRTWANAAWSDITLALAADFSSPGEITTRRAAGDKWIGYPLPRNLERLTPYPLDLRRVTEKVARLIAGHPACKAEGIQLNIAGNGAFALKNAGIKTGSLVCFIEDILAACKEMGVTILEVRSGGQTGVDEAAIKAAQRQRMKCSVLAPKGFRMRDERGNDHEGRGRFVARFKEEVIDHDAWNKTRGDDALDWGMGEFNSFNAIDMLQWEIDLKIMHLNEREKNNG